MELLKILLVFLSIVVGLRLWKSLPLAILCGALLTAVLFQLGVVETLRISGRSLVSEMTITTLLAFYTIGILQKMLERRQQLAAAQQALNGLWGSKRVNVSLAPMLIGVLPSAGAVTICGGIVNETLGDSLPDADKAFITSYYRHIPEAFFPTFTSIIIGVQISGQPLSAFLLLTLPLVGVLILLGYLFYLRHIPRGDGQPLPPAERRRELRILFGSLWSVLLTTLLILIFELPVFVAVLISVAINIRVGKFGLREMGKVLREAVEPRLLIATACIMIFKDIIVATGVIHALPQTLSTLPLPPFLTYFLIFFFGTIISGQQAICAVGLPIAYAAFPDAGVPLFVFLMATGYAAMQISPTHICLAVVSEYFHVDMWALVKKTLPVILTFSVVVIGYYLLLTQLF